jgi:serine/threonine protein kinase
VCLDEKILIRVDSLLVPVLLAAFGFNPVIEIICQQEYNERVDVYDFGLLLWELLTRKYPYSEYRNKFKEQKELEAAILEGLRPTIPADCPGLYADLIRSCWDNDPMKRPTFDQIRDALPSIAAVVAPGFRAPSKEEKEEQIQRTTRENLAALQRSISQSISRPSTPRGHLDKGKEKDDVGSSGRNEEKSDELSVVESDASTSGDAGDTLSGK